MEMPQVMFRIKSNLCGSINFEYENSTKYQRRHHFSTYHPTRIANIDSHKQNLEIICHRLQKLETDSFYHGDDDPSGRTALISSTVILFKEEE